MGYRRGSGRLQTSISKQAELVVGPGHSADVWGVLGGLCLPSLWTPAHEGATLFSERRLSRARAVL